MPISIVLLLTSSDRRVAAGAEALAFLEREAAVGGGLVPVHAELALEMLGRLGRPGQRTGQVGADAQLVPARPARGRTSRRSVATSYTAIGGMPEILGDEVHAPPSIRYPCSSWAMVSAAITAERFWSGGYLAIARSILARIPGSTCITSNRSEAQRRREAPDDPSVRRSLVPLCASARSDSSVDLAEHDVHRADDRHHVGDHVAPGRSRPWRPGAESPARGSSDGTACWRRPRSR